MSIRYNQEQDDDDQAGGPKGTGLELVKDRKDDVQRRRNNEVLPGSGAACVEERTCLRCYVCNCGLGEEESGECRMIIVGR